MLLQINETVDLTSRAMDHYGPYAFGLVSVVVVGLLVMGVVIMVWRLLVIPLTTHRERELNANAESMASMRSTIDALGRIAGSMSDMQSEAFKDAAVARETSRLQSELLMTTIQEARAIVQDVASIHRTMRSN